MGGDGHTHHCRTISLVDLLIVIAELLSVPFQIVGELLATIIAYVYHAAFSKPKLDDDGQPVPNDNRPANRWEILGYSLLGTAALSLVVGGVCWLAFQSFFAAQCGAGIAAFLGVIGALKAAIT